MAPLFVLQIPPMPSTSLPALERHLEARLLELEKTHRARPSSPRRGRPARRRAALRLVTSSSTSPSLTLHDAAVRLRLLGANIERGHPARLLAGALAAMETALSKGLKILRPQGRGSYIITAGDGGVVVWEIRSGPFVCLRHRYTERHAGQARTRAEQGGNDHI